MKKMRRAKRWPNLFVETGPGNRERIELLRDENQPKRKSTPKVMLMLTGAFKGEGLKWPNLFVETGPGNRERIELQRDENQPKLKSTPKVILMLTGAFTGGG